ncbi:MAG: YraN family protein [Oscillospiraceae bacterium]|nr:YraN family protein [Oscillospiraceae bacterium]
MDTLQRGNWGEKVALEYLSDKGYTTVSKGFRSRFGEIDIIVKNREFLVFVEVKTRKNADFAHAREFVTKSKQKKIIATANYYLAKRPAKLQPRFDVMEIYTQPYKINHIENAFGVN